MWNAGLNEAEAGSKTAGKNMNNLRYSDDTTLMAESKEELKSLLMKVKEENEKAGLKPNIQKTMVFPAVMNVWESWIVKKAECRRINAFELWCWRRLFFFNFILFFNFTILCWFCHISTWIRQGDQTSQS